MNRDEDSRLLSEYRGTEVVEYEPLDQAMLLRDVKVAEDQLEDGEGIEHTEVKKRVLTRLVG
jgi:hypothetical protein